ncbi:putative RING-H2 finger protein ATL71 [Quercus robur]|uniref:putative RING-H2 finger protein ATL71 n=1 Tax=Quercus robur TaxID=38942 RepID=UPI002161B450|nr:putative RING-H2 finger protein ATL71 [Quercus robur]
MSANILYGLVYIIIPFSFITVMFIVILLLCYCSVHPSLQIRNLATAEQNAITLELGLHEATLDKYPKLIYAQAKLHKNKANSTASCCSICLADYKDTDVLRDLPDCGHLFHLECVDSWLKLHATCPVCRNSPLAKPVPLEVSH